MVHAVKNGVNMNFKHSFFVILVVLFPSLLTCEETDSSQEEVAPQVATTFVQDVMQPLGAPLVSAYFAMRENLFLNAKVKNSSPLESVGNFFLTPSRYLFGGKTVKVEENGVQTYPSFHYDRWHWLKSACCVVALPVAEVLGVTCKGVAQLSSKVRKRNASIKKGSMLRSQSQMGKAISKQEFRSSFPRNSSHVSNTNAPQKSIKSRQRNSKYLSRLSIFWKNMRSLTGSIAEHVLALTDMAGLSPGTGI